MAQAENNFCDDGTEMEFELGTQQAVIKATTANKKQGVVHDLFIDGRMIEVDFS